MKNYSKSAGKATKPDADCTWSESERHLGAFLALIQPEHCLPLSRTLMKPYDAAHEENGWHGNHALPAGLPSAVPASEFWTAWLLLCRQHNSWSPEGLYSHATCIPSQWKPECSSALFFTHPCGTAYQYYWSVSTALRWMLSTQIWFGHLRSVAIGSIKRITWLRCLKPLVDCAGTLLPHLPSEIAAGCRMIVMAISIVKSKASLAVA